MTTLTVSALFYNDILAETYKNINVKQTEMDGKIVQLTDEQYPTSWTICMERMKHMEKDIMQADLLTDDLRVFIVPAEILDMNELSNNEKLTYMILRSHCGPDNTCFPSYATIARKGSFSRDTSIRCVRRLIELGLLIKEPRRTINKNDHILQTSNMYKLISPRNLNKGSSTMQPPPQSHHATTLVASCDHPSRTVQPEKDHLKKSTEKNLCVLDEHEEIPNDENNNQTIDNETLEQLAKILGEQLSWLINEKIDWGKFSSKEALVALANYCVEMQPTSPVAYFRRGLKEQWDLHISDTPINRSSSTSSASGKPKIRDNRYSAFYELFPDA